MRNLVQSQNRSVGLYSEGLNKALRIKPYSGSVPLIQHQICWQSFECFPSFYCWSAAIKDRFGEGLLVMQEDSPPNSAESRQFSSFG